jgi:hypothetical protein
MWIQNQEIKGVPAARLLFQDGVGIQRRFLEADTDHLNDLLSSGSAPYFDNLGLLVSSQTGVIQPSVSSCGTSPPPPSGSDNAFLVNTGGGSITTCTITFGNAAHWVNNPVCTVTGTVSGLYFDTVPTPTGFRVKSPTNFASTQFYVICFGR